MNNKTVYYSIAAVLLLFSAYAVYKSLSTNPFNELMSTQQSSPGQNNTEKSDPVNDDLSEMLINDKKVFVEIVDDNQSRARGLSGRERLPDDHGMLFVYNVANYPPFWMKDMMFDLDMIWIYNGKIVDITKNVPAPQPGTSLEELPKYLPSQAVDAILEVNAGFVDQNNIQIGDSVTLVE